MACKSLTSSLLDVIICLHCHQTHVCHCFLNFMDGMVRSHLIIPVHNAINIGVILIVLKALQLAQ